MKPGAVQYPIVWYFAAPPAYAPLRALTAETPWRNVCVYHYPLRLHELGVAR
jgi:hypothetical protein